MLDLLLSCHSLKERQTRCSGKLNLLLLGFGQTIVHVLENRLVLVYI